MKKKNGRNFSWNQQQLETRRAKILWNLNAMQMSAGQLHSFIILDKYPFHVQFSLSTPCIHITSLERWGKPWLVSLSWDVRIPIQFSVFFNFFSQHETHTTMLHKFNLYRVSLTIIPLLLLDQFQFLIMARFAHPIEVMEGNLRYLSNEQQNKNQWNFNFLSLEGETVKLK